jgi:hypothetical protein
MKSDSMIILLLAFSLVTIAIAGIIGDMNSHYDINSSTDWENKYNYATQINDSISKVQLVLKKLVKKLVGFLFYLEQVQ